MNRIEKKFLALKKSKKKALIVFMTAGDPSLAKNEALALAIEKDGVDLLELGVPFSDPLADGPVIQASSQRSLKRGTTLPKILSLVKAIRRKSEMPIALMSYANPIFHYGLKKFALEAKAAGVDGLIIPDLPPEEGIEWMSVLKRSKLDLVFLLAPTSSRARIRSISRHSRGFVYYVSITGVTGVKSTGQQISIEANIKEVKKNAKIPVCVGFGISTPEQAKKACKTADGVIVGSALVKKLDEKKSMPALSFSKRYVRPFAVALGKNGAH